MLQLLLLLLFVQVQRTCERLDRLGFTDIRTLEILLRTYEVSTESLHKNAANVQQPNKQNKKRGRSGAAAASNSAVIAEADPPAAAAAAAECDFVNQVLAKPLMDARGHTGYLTFARKFVAALPIDDEDQQQQQQQQQENGHLDAAAGAEGDAGELGQQQQQGLQQQQQQLAGVEVAAEEDDLEDAEGNEDGVEEDAAH